MNKRLSVFAAISIVSILLMASLLQAEENCSKEEVVKAVDQAVDILEKEGSAGLEKIGELRFCGDNYLFVNDFSGKTLMHPKSHLIGKVLIGLKDDTGKRFFADFTEMAKSSEAEVNGTTIFNGKGWVSYRWPKPGEKEFSPKLSYIRGCMMGEENIYVGAGIYE
ncbi:MAG: cache domain-containing protein [Desulfamplus sp.]|nr:cache domain-containing protein [Desulfamplus sp.]